MKKTIELATAYFKSVLQAIMGKHVPKWNVFYIGHNGISQISFLLSNFEPSDRIFHRAEKEEDRKNGIINDVYMKATCDNVNRIAIYIKEIVD